MNVDRAALTKMPMAEMVALYNKLTGKSVKRFADRKDGISRILTAQEDKAPAAAKPAKTAPTPKEAPAAQPAPAPAPAPADAAPPVQEPAAAPAAKQPRAPKPLTIAARAGDVKPPRPDSKRGQLLVALQTADGISVEEMMARFEWKAADCGDALRLLAKQNGVSVARDEAGRWRVAE